MFKAAKTLPAVFLTTDKRRLSWVSYSFLALLCLAFFIPGFATLPPVDRDETSFAQASKQMIETGNYVDIRLQDKPRYKKPIGIYWLQTASVHLFNSEHLSEIWAYRLPSLAGATFAVLMTAALGSLLFGPLAGFIAAVMMASSILLNVEARLAKTDAALLATIMAAQLALARTYMGKVRWPVLNGLQFWTALGFGILIKGPIIVLVVISTLLWLRYEHKTLKWFHGLRPLYGIPYMLLLTAPWFIAILMQSHGQFLQDSAGHDLLGKIWQGQDRGILPPGLHILASLFVFFPFSLLIYLAVPDIWKTRHQPNIAFCLGWIIPTWIVFELSLTKLPHYVLPTYPAIALLAARAFTNGYPRLLAMKSRWFLTSMATLWLLAGGVVAAGLAFLPYIIDHEWSVAQAVASILLVLIQGFALVMLAQRHIGSIWLLTCSSLVFISCSFGLTLPQLEHLWATREIYELAEVNQACEQTSLLSVGYDEPSLVFVAGTQTQLINDGHTAANALLQNPCSLAVVDHGHQADFLAGFDGSNKMPTNLGDIDGYNIGHGQMAHLTLYSLPLR